MKIQELVFKVAIILALLTTVLLAGCGGSDGAPRPTGPTVDPSVSGVNPGQVFLARKPEVAVSGFGTKFSSSTRLDFGQGISVGKLSVASPTAIVASLTVDKASPLGAHDVTITDGTSTLTFKGAFQVEAPVAFSFHGTPAQGSIFVGHARNKDLSTPFDTTHTGDGQFTPITYTGITFGALADFTFSLNSVSLFEMDFLAGVDVNAAPGAKALSFTSGRQGDNQDEFLDPAGVTIQARTPMATTSATPVIGNVTRAFDSQLYQFTPAAGVNVFELSVTSGDAASAPAIYLLPKSGKFRDLLGIVQKRDNKSKFLVTNSADPIYGIYWDSTGTSNYQYTATPRAIVPVASARALTSNTTASTAQRMSALPFVATGGTLANASDQHWFSFTAAAGDVGKKIRIVTTPGDPFTDTEVAAYRSDGTTRLGTDSEDDEYHKNWLTPPIPAAGVYYVKVFASPAFQPTHKDYQLFIRLE